MLVSTAIAFLAATSAPTAEVGPTAPSATQAKEKKICRKEAAVTGSLTSRRVCKTKAEWEGTTTAEDKTAANKKLPLSRD